MNYKSTNWNSFLETLRVEIDQAISGCFSLSTHHNKFHRLTISLSHFSKKLIDFVDEKRTLTQEELKNFQDLIKILLNLIHFIDDFSDFYIDKTLESIGIDFFTLPLNKILEFIKDFNYYTQQLDLPLIVIDEKLLKEDDNVNDVAQLLNFIQSRALFYQEKNKEIALLYENLTNKVFDLIKSEKTENQIIKNIYIRRKEFIKRKKKNSSKNSSNTFYGSYELNKALKSKSNVRIFKLKDIDIDRSHCVHHGKHSNFFSGVLKSSKRIVSFEIYHSVIFSEDEYNSFIQKVKTMNDANYFTTIPLIGVVLDEPFIIVSEFMPQGSLFDWFHDPNNNEFTNENDSHIAGLESGPQRKFKMQFDQNSALSSSSDIFKSRQSILALNSSSSFGSYQQIRKESAPPKKELRQTIIALGVAYALRYLHSKGIVHMSLKMSEIFIDANGRPKIKCSKKALKKNSKINKINPKDVKAWTAPELIDVNRLANEIDNENEIDDEFLDEDSVGSNSSTKDRTTLLHSSSTVIINETNDSSHQSLNSHNHSRGAKKSLKKLIPFKKVHSSGIALENCSPAPLPPIANSNESSFNETSSDLLNKPIVLSTKVDVYAFGIMLWELLTKEIAFDGLSSTMIANEVINNNQRPLIPQNCPSNLMKFIQDCWATDPKMRPDFDEICLMLESGNYNFPGTDTEELNSYKDYCARLNDQFLKSKENQNEESEFAEFDKMQLLEPESFYNNPNLSIEMMINAFIKEGSCEDLKFITKLSELVKNSKIPQSNSSTKSILTNSSKLLNSSSDINNNDIEKVDEKNNDSTYIFTDTSLSLLSSFFLSSNLKIRLIAVDLITYIYNNHLFNDERSIAGILPKIVLNVSQISSLSINFVDFKVFEAQEIVLTSMKLLSLLSSKYVTSGFINNKISSASISYIINMAFSECSSLREVSFDFYMSFLSKFQASNKLLMQFTTKLAQFNVDKTTCNECIKIIKVIKLISRNDRLFTLLSLDEKSLETVSQFLVYDKLVSNEKENLEDEDEDNSKDDESGASDYKILLNMMKSKENKGDGSLLQKLTEKQTPNDVVISSLRLLFILVTGSQYLHYYTKMVDKLASKLTSTNKVISSISCAVLARLIPAIVEKREPSRIPENFTDKDLPSFKADEFSFLTDEILLKMSENLDEYSIRLFGAISSTYASAQINIRNDEIILQRLLKKMKESLKSIKSLKESEAQASSPITTTTTNDNNLEIGKINLSSFNDSNDNVKKDDENENDDDDDSDKKDKDEKIGALFNKISFALKPNLGRPNNTRNITMRSNFKINSLKMQNSSDDSKKVDAFPLLFRKSIDATAEEEKKREEEGRLAALVLESQSSQTPSSKVLLEAIDTFFDYYFFFNDKEGVDDSLTFDEEDKLRECQIFLSNMALDPKAALCIFKRIDKIMKIASIKNSPAASTFFHVTLTYEVQEKIRKICKKYLKNESESDDDDKSGGGDDDDENDDVEVELLNDRNYCDLIEDMIKKCVCFWNTVYSEDSMQLLEFFSTIPSARKLLVKFEIISKIRNYIKNSSVQKQKLQPIIIEIQEEKKILENLKQQQIKQKKLMESLLMPHKNNQYPIFNFNENKSDNDKTQKQFTENQQKYQILLRQIKQQQEKIEHLQKKEIKMIKHDSNLRVLCNRILARFV